MISGIEDFSGVDEEQVPGRNRWIASLCRQTKFKPRFIASPDGVTNVLSMVVSEAAVTLLPGYFKTGSHPGAISDSSARWDFIVLWQRGRTTAPVSAFVKALKVAAAAVS